MKKLMEKIEQQTKELKVLAKELEGTAKELEEMSAEYPLGGMIEPYDMATEDELVRSQERLDYKSK